MLIPEPSGREDAVNHILAKKGNISWPEMEVCYGCIPRWGRHHQRVSTRALKSRESSVLFPAFITQCPDTGAMHFMSLCCPTSIAYDVDTSGHDDPKPYT